MKHYVNSWKLHTAQRLAGILGFAAALIFIYMRGYKHSSQTTDLLVNAGLLFLAAALVDGVFYRFLVPRLAKNQFQTRTILGWFAAAWICGIYLILAVPITLPVHHIEKLTETLVNLNFVDLSGKSLLPLLIVLCTGGVVGIGLFLLSAILATWQPRYEPEQKAKPTLPGLWSGFFFSFPMILVWGIYLLSFWPAIISLDSVYQWGIIQRNAFSNVIPILHTITYWLIIQVWDSPSAIAIVQILGLSLLVGFELSFLHKKGLPMWAAFAISFLFALSPVNGTLLITLWKDTLYSVAILAFSILILNLILDETRYSRQKWLWLSMGSLAVLVGLYRHNGLVIPPVVLILMMVIYREYRWQAAKALAFFVCAVLLVQGPVMDLLHVNRLAVVTESLALHHIAAHIDANSPLTAQEKALKDRLLPEDGWGYYCYTVNKVASKVPFDKKMLRAEEQAINQMAIHLFLENPTIDIKQTLCAGSLVYQVIQPSGVYLATSAAGGTQDDIHYITTNTLGVEQAPILPGMTRILAEILNWTTREINLWLTWRPALYLYLFLFSGIVLALRLRSWKALIYLIPGLIQSSVMFLVNIAQDFRYQYPLYLLGLFSIGLLFLPVEKKKDQ